MHGRNESLLPGHSMSLGAHGSDDEGDSLGPEHRKVSSDTGKLGALRGARAREEGSPS